MHGHSRSHAVDRSANRRRLTVVLALVVGYMIAEVVGGILSNSLALLADAGHMLSDAAALSLSLFAVWMAGRPPTPQRTYGYHRTEILAALFNGAALIALSLMIILETWERFRTPPEIDGLLMLGVASGGLVINLIGLRILSQGKSASLNVRGAWLHVLGDALGSVGAITAGILVWKFGWGWADPVASLLIAVLIIYSSWSLVSESLSVLMEHVPSHIDAVAVKQGLLERSEVADVHDLHIWTITSGLIACSAHITVGSDCDRGPVLDDVSKWLAREHGIGHTTIQIDDPENGDCEMPV